MQPVSLTEESVPLICFKLAYNDPEARKGVLRKTTGPDSVPHEIPFEKLLDKVIIRYRSFRFVCSYWTLPALYAICFGGSYDPLLQTLSRGDILLDAGANIGVLSIIASQKVDKVYAVEPDPQNFSLLIRNIQLNRIKNIIPVKVALTDVEGISFLQGKGEHARISCSGTKIHTTTIDRLTDDPISAIKMDIEGSEIKALQGARKAMPGVNKIAVETDYSHEWVAKYLETNGLSISGTWSTTMRSGHVMRKLFSIDLLLNEFTARFVISSAIISKAIPIRRPPWRALRDTRDVKILYAFRKTGK